MPMVSRRRQVSPANPSNGNQSNGNHSEARAMADSPDMKLKMSLESARLPDLKSLLASCMKVEAGY